MKGKRRSIDKKVRILRKADGEMTVLQVCDEYNISEQSLNAFFVTSGWWRKAYGSSKPRRRPWRDG